MPNEKMKALSQGFFNSKRRSKRFAKVPMLSTEEENQAILNFLNAGKGKRYPPATTLDISFKDDKVCQTLLAQATKIEIKDG